MNKYDKHTLKVFGILVAIVVGVIAPLAYEYSHAWSETGTISWVGAKVYNDQKGVFVAPFAVTVPVHGTFNFTYVGPTRSGLCGNADYQASPPVKGTLVALIKLQCGGYDLVVDP